MQHTYWLPLCLTLIKRRSHVRPRQRENMLKPEWAEKERRRGHQIKSCTTQRKPLWQTLPPSLECLLSGSILAGNQLHTAFFKTSRWQENWGNPSMKLMGFSSEDRWCLCSWWKKGAAWPKCMRYTVTFCVVFVQFSNTTMYCRHLTVAILQLYNHNKGQHAAGINGLETALWINLPPKTVPRRKKTTRVFWEITERFSPSIYPWPCKAVQFFHTRKS